MLEHFRRSRTLIALGSGWRPSAQTCKPTGSVLRQCVMEPIRFECALPKVAKSLGPGRRRRAMPKKESAILLGMALPRVFRVDFEKDSARDYLSWVEMLVNVVVRLVPRVLTAAMIATEMPAAIRPYSMAVAPLSSFRKRRISVFIR